MLIKQHTPSLQWDKDQIPAFVIETPQTVRISSLITDPSTRNTVYAIAITHETVKLRDRCLARCLADIPDFYTTLHRSSQH